MKTFKNLTAALFFIMTNVITTANAVSAESLLVIANVDNALNMSRQQVKNLYMAGRNASKLEPITLPPGNQNRIIFNTKVIGLTESRIHSYWAQMHFTGRGKPPIEFDSSEDILDYIEKTPGTIGYVPKGTLISNKLIVLLEVD